LGLASLLALTVFAAASSEARRRADATVTLGIIQPYTGDSAYYGQYGDRAFAFAQSKYGASPAGNTLSFSRGDSKCTPTDAVQAGHQVLAHKPVALLAPACSGDTLALKPLLAAAHVPACSINLAPTITSGAPHWVFRIAPSDTVTNALFAKYMKSKGVKNIGIIHDTTGYGQGNDESLTAGLKAAGIRVAADASYGFSDTDYSGQIVSLKQKNVDAVYLEGYDVQVANLVKQVRSLGLDVPIYANTNAGNVTALKTGGSAMNGVIFATAFLPDWSPGAKAYTAAWIKKYHQAPDVDQTDLYQCAAVILSALRQVGPNPTGDAMRSQLAKLKLPGMPSGTIRFNATGDLVNPPVLVGTWVNGKTKLVKLLSGSRR
jgi:branched-chain amino acid transport system substrate-binding protein